MLVQAEEFPQDPLEAVAHHGRPDPAPGGDADLADRGATVAIDGEVGGMRPLPLPHHLAEFPVGAHPLVSWQPGVLLWRAALPGREDHFFPLTATVRRLRPLARRRDRTSLPALVDIRSRNPWVRFLRVL
jgi:hypothetical protein